MPCEKIQIIYFLSSDWSREKKYTSTYSSGTNNRFKGLLTRLSYFQVDHVLLIHQLVKINHFRVCFGYHHNYASNLTQDGNIQFCINVLLYQNPKFKSG